MEIGAIQNVSKSQIKFAWTPYDWRGMYFPGQALTRLPAWGMELV
jgi:hypothetical protein